MYSVTLLEEAVWVDIEVFQPGNSVSTCYRQPNRIRKNDVKLHDFIKKRKIDYVLLIALINKLGATVRW